MSDVIPAVLTEANSQIDPLTKALRRDTLNSTIADWVSSDGEQVVFSVLFIDIDYFKTINDAFGHQRGDKALTEVAARIQNALRDKDLLFRYSGDEFIVLAAKANLAEAAALGSRLLRTIAATPLAGLPPINCTLSVGIACFPDDGHSADALIGAADKRLYQAKRGGRNKMVASLQADQHASWQHMRPRLVERDEAITLVREVIAATVASTTESTNTAAARENLGLILNGRTSAGYSRLIEEAEIAARQIGLRSLTLRGCGTQKFSSRQQRLKFDPDADAYLTIKQAFSKRDGDVGSGGSGGKGDNGVSVASGIDKFKHWCREASPGLILIDDWHLIDAPSFTLMVDSLADARHNHRTIALIIALPHLPHLPHLPALHGLENSAAKPAHPSAAPHTTITDTDHINKALVSVLFDTDAFADISVCNVTALSAQAFGYFVNGIFASGVSSAFCSWMYEAASGLPGIAMRAFFECERQGLLKLVNDQVLPPTEFRKLDMRAVRGSDVPHNLPLTAKNLIGRDDVTSQIATELKKSRFVNLTGTGGIGKTAIAIQVAMDIRFRFEDGAWFVELAQVTDRDLLVFAIAKALGLPLDASLTPVRALAALLAGKQVLLVLDNLEQVVEAAGGVIAQLLAACPRLTILSTSRARLLIAEEAIFQLPSLIEANEFAAINHQYANLEAQQADPAVPSHAALLFIERAMSVQPQLTIGPDKLQMIEAICISLDGLPLAIELAAARLRTLPLDDIAALMLSATPSRLANLGASTRSHAASVTALPIGVGSVSNAVASPTTALSNGAANKQTLRDAIQTSVSLLQPSEVETFYALSVMGGRFDVATVNQLIGRPVDDDIAALANASLLNEKFIDNTPTFLMLETLREFGQEKLQANGRWSYMRARHVRHTARVAAIGRTEPIGESLQKWRNRMDRLSGDMREALTWAITSHSEQDLQSALAAYGDACAWWEISGRWQEALNWWQRLQPLLVNMAASYAVASATHTAARCSFMLARYAECELLYQDALAHANNARDMQTAAAALTGLGNHANFRVNTEDGRVFYTQALERYRKLAINADAATKLGLQARVAYCLNTLGLVTRQAGELSKQMDFYQEAATLRAAIGDDFGLAQSHLCIGTAYNDVNDAIRAQPYFTKAIAVLRSYQESRFLPMALSQEIVSYTLANQPLRALQNVAEVVGVARRAHDKRRLLFTLAVSIAPLRLLGESRVAVSLLAATTAICRQEEINLMTPDQAMIKQEREMLRAQLTEPYYREAVRAGETLTLDAALDNLLSAVRAKL